MAVPSPVQQQVQAENEDGAMVRARPVSLVPAVAATGEAALSRPRTSDPPSSDSPPDTGVPLIADSQEGSFLWRVRGMVRTVRPHQWVKNLFVLAPIVFARELTRPTFILAAVGAFAVFCLLAGAVYTLNDLMDVEADRVHPVKRYRPIASGRVPVPVAWAMGAVLVVAALGSALTVGLVYHRIAFFVVAVAYFAQNVAYSFGLKKVAYVDVGFIAFGFVLRVLAGGYATRTPISGYMIACTALLALFLGFGKRRHELAGANASKQRAALDTYSPRILTAALWITGLASIGTYIAWALDPPAFFHNTPWLWVTAIHPLFGVARFVKLVVARPKAESPTQEMLRDVPFVLNLVVWAMEVIAIVYHVRFE